MDSADPTPKTPTPEIFIGEANPAEARFYARLSWDWDQRASLAGTVSGPFCRYSRTLPARVALVDQGPGSALLAEAIVPDPCFWTPDLPFLYEVDVQFRACAPPRSSPPLPIGKRTVGIRPLGVRGNRLILEGKAWVLRGGLAASAGEFPLTAWHDAATAMWVSNPGDDLCAEASHVGVLLLAELSPRPEQLLTELRRLSGHAAVGFAILPAATKLDDELRQAAGNMVLVQRLAVDRPSAIAPWAQAVICPADDLAAGPGDCRLPIIASRPLAHPGTVQDVRAACDRLQRDLAGRGDFAGYIV